jgi:hypothetical protein
MHIIREKNYHRTICSVSLFVRTLPINYTLLGEMEIHKIKETSKLKDKQTSIAAVRDQLLSFAILVTD